MNIELDGHSAYAYTGGKPFDPKLPGVAFVHGALHDHSVWILQSRYLAHHGHAVLAVDLPAHGRSAGEPLGVEAAGRWLAGLIEASGLRRAALVGHSMGSLIALEAAAQLGARASARGDVGTGYPMKVSSKLLELCQRDALAAIDLVNALSNSTHAAKPSSRAGLFDPRQQPRVGAAHATRLCRRKPVPPTSGLRRLCRAGEHCQQD